MLFGQRSVLVWSGRGVAAIVLCALTMLAALAEPAAAAKPRAFVPPALLAAAEAQPNAVSR